MPKVSFWIEDKGTLNFIDTALQLGKNMKDPLERAGLFLLRSTDKRFRDEVSFTGKSWEPLSEITEKRRRKGKKGNKYGNSILRDTGRLFQSVTPAKNDNHVYRLDNSKVEIGTNVIYANVHQFGNPKLNIPARPFLGISEDDEKKINGVFVSWANERLDDSTHKVRFLK